MDLRAHEVASLDGFTPTPEHHELAASLGLDADALLIDWRLQRKATGKTLADPDADFERWIRREPGFSNGNGRHEEPAHGVVRHFEQAPPEPDEPPVTSEQRQAGRDLVRQAIADSERKALGARDSGPMPDETVDPVTTARRENERQRQRAAVTEKLEAESGQPTGGAAA